MSKDNDMVGRGIYYDSTHKELIVRLGKIDAFGKREQLAPQYLAERVNILEQLVTDGVAEYREAGGFNFIGNSSSKNRLLYLDTIDCS